MSNRLKLFIFERDPERDMREIREQALRYYNALHELSISEGKRDIYLLLMENKQRFEKQLAECESEKIIGWLQGAIQLIDCFLEEIDNAGANLHELRTQI